MTYPSDVHQLQALFDSAAPLLPPGIVRAWTNNEYRIGDRHSTDYEFIGTTFALRGYYRYSTYSGNAEDVNDLLHSGYCVIDLDGPDLFMAGVRVYTGERQKARYAEQKEWAHPIYWRSQFSKFVSDGGLPKVHFGYRLFKISNSLNLNYQPEGISTQKPFSPSALETFKAIEEFWSSRRHTLDAICVEAIKNGKTPQFQEQNRDLDDHIIAYLQDPLRFPRHLNFLQHHLMTPEHLVGVITVDASKLLSEERRLVGAVFQPVDLVTLPADDLKPGAP